MKACFKPQEAQTYLRTLFGHYREGWIEFRSFRTGYRPETKSFRLPGCLSEGMPEIRAQIEEWTSRARDVYVGVLPRSTQSGSTKRDVLAIGCFWVDLDRKVPGAKLELLEQCDMVVDTGNGWHGYFLGSPKALGSDRDRQLRERGIKKWQQQILDGVDSTHDLSRVLRVAGTVNHKAEPKQVTLLRPAPTEDLQVLVPGDRISRREILGLDRIAPPPDWTAEDQSMHERAWVNGWETDPRIPDIRALEAVTPWPDFGLAMTAEYEWVHRILMRMVARGDRWVDLLDYCEAMGMDEPWLERTLAEFRADALR